MASVTIVVEAAERSGSLITARIARELGRDVGAVPGRITSPRASGSNDLLADGAHVVRGVDDVLDLLFGVGTRPARDAPARPALEPHLEVLLEAVADGRDTIGALAHTTDLAASTMAGLAELELRGLLRRGAGGRYVPVTSGP